VSNDASVAQAAVMIDPPTGPLRLGSSHDQESTVAPASGTDEFAFLAYGEDCILSGRAELDAARLTDMLNAHDEYVLVDVTVERLDDGEPFEVAEIAVPRDEIYLVHGTDQRGDAARRHHTSPQHLALKMGPYEVRGFFHALPGADPVEAMRRRTAMVPLTDARIEYTCHGEWRETRVGTVIVNREQIDWAQAVPPGQVEFPEGPEHLAPKPA
jgi:hypothetical protein